MTTPATEGDKAETKKEFIDRGRREGWYEDWHADYQQCLTEGMHQPDAWVKAARKHGWNGKAKGLGSFVSSTPTPAPVVVVGPRIGARLAREFEEALAKLPTEQVDRRVEMAWIRNHPAMCRKARLKGNTEPVLMTADDIAGAPSRAAAILLQNWADNPKAFNDNFGFALIKKDGGEGEGDKQGEVIPDPTLDEVERMLKEFSASLNSESNSR